MDLTFSSEELPIEEIDAILAGYRKKCKYYRLPDGSFLLLENNGKTMAELAEGYMLIPGYRSFYLDQIFRERGEDLQVKRSPEFKTLIQETKTT